MKTAENANLYDNPVVSAINQVSNFNPLNFLAMTEDGPRLDLKYKKLWFRLKHPQGRIRFSNIRITDQLAIIEARVFLDRKDADCVANYTATCTVTATPNGDYIKAAQDAAADRALSEAGFGIQFDSEVGKIQEGAVEKTPVAQPKVVTLPPVQTVEAPVVEQPKVVEQTKVETPAPVQATVPVVAQVVEQPKVETPAPVQVATPAVAPAVEQPKVETPVVEQPQVVTPPPAQVVEMPAPTVVAPAPTAPAAPSYNKSMSVEEICAVMTLEEAENYTVPSGACAGQKLSLVAERRPASLRYYINGYKGDDNILIAAAKKIAEARPEILAG